MNIMDAHESANVSARDGFSLGEPLSLMGVCLDPESLSDVKQFAASMPLVRLLAPVTQFVAEDDDSLQGWIPGSPPEVCLIDFDANRRSATLTAEKIHANLPGTAIFAVSSNSQPSLIIEAMRCGCSEYLVKPLNHDQLLEAVARVDGRRKERKEVSNGQVLAFVGAKGGSGVTTMATHLGALLAKSYARRTLLVDLHPTFGEAAFYLGITKHKYSFYELVENKDRLDANLLRGFLLRHSSGLEVLPAPDSVEPSRQLAENDIGHTIDFLRSRYDFVVVDCPPGLSKPNLEVIARCDWLYLVLVPEVSAVANGVRCLDYLTRAEYPLDRVKVVLNRHLKRGIGITDDQIEKALRRQIYWKVPNQYNQVIRTIHGGDPSSQITESEVARTMLAWAESLGKQPDSPGDAKKGSKRLFGRLGR